jgi:BlaI family transcriptional regulator, penicillinase repressor
MDQVSLGERELDVMTVLWTVGPGTVAEVKDRLPAALAYNTVLTILRNLEAKGLVDHEAEGRVFRYFPVVTQQAVKKNAVARLVSKFFAGSPVDVMAHLLDSKSLSAAELRALHEHLDARLREKEDEDACS